MDILNFLIVLVLFSLIFDKYKFNNSFGNLVISHTFNHRSTVIINLIMGGLGLLHHNDYCNIFIRHYVIIN